MRPRRALWREAPLLACGAVLALAPPVWAKLKDFVPGGVCPEGLPKSATTAGPAENEVGPGTSQKIIMMGLGKQGTTSASRALSDLGYHVAHHSALGGHGDALGQDGCTSVISDCCYTSYGDLDRRHPEATWVLLYSDDFEQYWSSAVRHWIQKCLPHKRESAIFTALTRLVPRSFAQKAERLGFNVTFEEGLAITEQLSDFFRMNKRLPHGEGCAPSFFEENPNIKAFVKESYAAYHALLYCYFEDRAHAELQVRGRHPWEDLRDFVRNGTDRRPIDVTVPFPHSNDHNANPNTKEAFAGLQAGHCGQ